MHGWPFIRLGSLVSETLFSDRIEAGHVLGVNVQWAFDVTLVPAFQGAVLDGENGFGDRLMVCFHVVGQYPDYRADSEMCLMS
jgi:hypothetical protein